MKLLARYIIDEAIRVHADSARRLQAWTAIVERATWHAPHEVRRAMGSADFVADKIVFDIGGNRYRLIARADYANGIVRVLWFGTHAAYDRIKVEDL